MLKRINGKNGKEYDTISVIICINDKDGHFKLPGYTFGKLYYEIKSSLHPKAFIDDDGDVRYLFEYRFRNATLLEKELFGD